MAIDSWLLFPSTTSCGSLSLSQTCLPAEGKRSRGEELVPAARTDAAVVVSADGAIAGALPLNILDYVRHTKATIRVTDRNQED